MKKVFKVTVSSNCNHVKKNEACPKCNHMSWLVAKFVNILSSQNAIISSDQKKWKPFSCEEILPPDYVEVQHESEYA